ncbi:LysR family transcriptional regulator [Radiobacillus sp. PE A8.2]|uniref:LysR family transcriptional regulator n=1 Tax=Radiobacillus sp. PE A8.2 TaxID=3380349 RepID=UPI00388F5295
MKIDDYQLLIALKESGTIRGASRSLLISQPALSQRLKQIESQWNEQIFIRSHKRLMVTPVGEEILRFAERIIKEEERAKENISRISKKVSGTLSLGVSSVVGQYVLPAVLQSYVSQYPEVKIQLQIGLSQYIRNTSDNFHVSIIRGDKSANQHCTHLFSDRLYLVDKKRSDATENQRPLIEFKSDPGFQQLVNQWFLEHSDVSFSQSIQVDQIETCKQLMAHGVGMAVLPEIALQDLSRDQFSFTPLIVDDKHLERHTWLCVPQMAMDLPQVRAFVETIGERKF